MADKKEKRTALPCPICKGAAVLVRSRPGRWSCVCCHTIARGTTEDEAIEAWNKEVQNNAALRKRH